MMISFATVNQQLGTDDTTRRMQKRVTEFYPLILPPPPTALLLCFDLRHPIAPTMLLYVKPRVFPAEGRNEKDGRGAKSAECSAFYHAQLNRRGPHTEYWESRISADGNAGELIAPPLRL